MASTLAGQVLSGRGVIGTIFFIEPILVACSKSLPVSIHGVNYTVDPFSYVVTDSGDPKNTGGGELIESYAAGGTMCCYELPRTWRPGIKVSVRSAHWLGKSADNSLRQVITTKLVEVPRYADGKPGELWVLRSADGSIDLVSSDFQPDNAKWPGKVKGWPVPSLAYQRQRWDLQIAHEKEGVSLYEKLLSELSESPSVRAESAWAHFLENDSKSIEGYRGPEDARFHDVIRGRYEEGLIRSRQRVKNLEKGRP